MRSLRTALVALGLVGLAIVVIAAFVIAGSDRFTSKGAWAPVLYPLVAASFIGTGLFAWWRRPDNRIGPLMTAVGFVWSVGTLEASDVPGVFIIALIVNPAAFAVLLHMLLAFPTGRLQGTLDRVLVGIGYADTLVLTFVALLFHETSTHDYYCQSDCPPNPILVSDQLGVAEFIFGAQSVIGTLGLAAIAYLLIRRWRAGSESYRRTVAPVYAAGVITAVLIGITLLADVTNLPDKGAEDVVDIIGLVAMATIPFAFLYGLMRSRLSRAGAVSELVARLADPESSRGLRDSLADALGDPTLSLVYWVPELERYVDASGQPVELPGGGEVDVCTYVERDGRPVGVICHDAALAEEPELLKAVSGAVSLALENERLDAELRARIEELQASRARIVEAADYERRRLERDLHDGAQQRLVTLAVNLRLAQSKLDSDPEEARALIEESAVGLGEATDELRELARGLHPAVLSDRGLGPALEALAGRAPVPVSMGEPPAERFPPAVESAAYFVVAEALTNVARYADASRAEVSVGRVNGQVEVEVRDDGVGGADPSVGTGLRGLSDRVAALNGGLRVDSPAGEGTVVRAVIPCE